MFKKLSDYLGNQARWNELGHSFFGFIVGIMHPLIIILWILFVLFEEIYLDGHWNFFRESENDRLDFLFDLQSKFIPAVFSHFLITYFYGITLTIIESLLCFVVVFILGYKGSWFFDKK